MADWIVELGPSGGSGGGEVVYEGEGPSFMLGEETATQACFK
jgi:excinuclease UvrABC ATPase subunit